MILDVLVNTHCVHRVTLPRDLYLDKAGTHFATPEHVCAAKAADVDGITLSGYKFCTVALGGSGEPSQR